MFPLTAGKIPCPVFLICRKFVDKCQMFDWSVSRMFGFFGRGQGYMKETRNLKWLAANGRTGSARNRDEANNSGRRTKFPGQ
jgi:hypothetical protein